MHGSQYLHYHGTLDKTLTNLVARLFVEDSRISFNTNENESPLDFEAISNNKTCFQCNIIKVILHILLELNTLLVL